MKRSFAVFVSSLLPVTALVMSGSSVAHGADWRSWLPFSLAKSRGTAEPSPSTIQIAEEKTQGRSTHIVGNETDNYLQFGSGLQPATAEMRALISAGSFRVFDAEALLNRDWTFSVDFAPGISEFNRNLAPLISTLGRLEFLRLLLDQSELKVVPPQSEREAIFELVNRLRDERYWPRSPIEERVAKFPESIRKNARAVIAELHDDHWPNWLSAVKSSASSEERWKMAFWGSDFSYRRLQERIRNDRFVAVTGSLSGDRTMKSIGNHLKRQSIIASEIDLSNTLEAIAGSEGAPGIAKLLKNLDELPTDTDSRILLTINANSADPGGKRRPRELKWHYQVYDFATFKSVVSAQLNEFSIAKLSTALLDAPQATPPRRSKTRLATGLTCTEVFQGIGAP